MEAQHYDVQKTYQKLYMSGLWCIEQLVTWRVGEHWESATAPCLYQLTESSG